MRVDPAEIQDHRSASSLSPALVPLLRETIKAVNRHRRNPAGPTGLVPRPSAQGARDHDDEDDDDNDTHGQESSVSRFFGCAACLILMRGLGNVARLLMAARQRSRDDARDLPAAIYPSVPVFLALRLSRLWARDFFFLLFFCFFFFRSRARAMIVHFVISSVEFFFLFFLLHFRFICVKISVTSPPPPHNRLSRELLRDNLSINVPDARVEHNQPIRILRKETRNEKSSVDEFFKLFLFFKLEERKKLLIL